MAIRVKPRARVEDEFITSLVEMARKYMTQLQKRLARLPEQFRKSELKRHSAQIARLQPLIKYPDTPGKGLDLEKARLRALDTFERFWIFTHEGQNYFVGTTRNIIMAELRQGKKPAAYWDIGPYDIFVPFRAFTSSSTEHIHMVPRNDIFTASRHPHHVAYMHDGDSHPVEMSARTCWSGFGQPVVGVIQGCDVTETFRWLGIFVQRYNPYSPLTRSWFGRKLEQGEYPS